MKNHLACLFISNFKKRQICGYPMFTNSVSENILFFVAGLGILQAVLLSALIYFHPRSDRAVNRFLALHILCLAVILSMPFVMRAVSWQKTVFMEPVPLFLGPFLYLYIRSFKERITWKKIVPHLLFGLLYLPVFYFPLASLINQYSGQKTIPKELMLHPLPLALFILRACQYLFYYVLSYRTLRSYQRSIRQLFSDISGISLRWIRWLINGFLFMVIVTIVVFPLFIRFPDQFALLFLINVAIATPYIYIATYKGITQSTLWQAQKAASQNELETHMQTVENLDVQPSKIAEIKQNDPRTQQLRQAIVTMMEDEKLYQEPDLTLQNLGERLGVPPYQVSLAINQGLGKSFYELVNSYRVEEAKRLLRNEQSVNYTILSVGFEAGFNSKTTFNTVFKKFTGLTPTEYRDRQ
jgi:AraC-like DNA-binding protein